MNQIALPNYYDRNEVGNLYQPRHIVVSEAGMGYRRFMQPAALDKLRVLLFLVDVQVDFVFPNGNLPVGGAVADTTRTIEFIYRNMSRLTAISASLDQHVPFQIFHPLWWVNAQGENPAPFTIITVEDVRRDVWRPSPLTGSPTRSVQYLEQLETQAKKNLMIWPFHCLEGSIGATLVPALSEAILCHSVARYAQPTYLPKGKISDSEFYSVMEPEVKRPNHPQGQLNKPFLDTMAKYDLIYMAGQARSHCVLETMNSLMRHFANQPEVISKIRFLDDCTSSIQGFEAPTEAAIAEFVRMGVQLVKSTDPIG